MNLPGSRLPSRSLGPGILPYIFCYRRPLVGSPGYPAVDIVEIQSSKIQLALVLK